MVLLLIFFLLISLSAFSGFLLLQSSLPPLRPLFLSLLRHLLVLLASLLVLVLSALLLHALLVLPAPLLTGLLLIFFLLISLSAFSGFLLLQSSLLPLCPLFLSLSCCCS